MKIIHIKQVHVLPFGIKPVHEIRELIIQSQFQVAQEIKKHPGCPILVESLYENGFDAASIPMSGAAKEIFPDGFPANFNELSSLQKEFLCTENGADAAHTLFYLGEIPSIYKSIHKEISDNIEERIRKGENYRNFDVLRETEAIACAKEAASTYFENTHVDPTVIIVFGGGHDLKRYCDKEGFEYEEINTDISTSYGQTVNPKKSQETVPLKTPYHNVTQYNNMSRMILSKDNIEEQNQLYSLKDYIDNSSKSLASPMTENNIQTHEQNASTKKNTDFESPVRIQFSPFFKSYPITNKANNVPKELLDAIADSSYLKNCLTKKHVTLKVLIDLQQNNPWVIGALRRSHIYEGICNHDITVDQLSRLTEDQVISIKDEHVDLQGKVNSYINSNQKQI